MMKRILKMIGIIALYALTYLLASVMVAIPIMIVILVKYFAANKGAFNAESLQNSLMSTTLQYTTLIVILTSILSLILFYVISLIRKKKMFRELNFKKVSFKNTGLLIATAAGLYFFVSYLTSFFMSLPQFQQFVPSYEKVAESLMSGNIIITILCVGFVAPVFEEIFFRNIILNELRVNIPLIPAIIIQALLFGLFHGNVIQGSYAFLIGIVFALAYIWTKSLWAPIILHMVFNCSSLVAGELIDGKASDSSLLILFIAGFAISALTLYLVWKNRVKDDISLEIKND